MANKKGSCLCWGGEMLVLALILSFTVMGCDILTHSITSETKGDKEVVAYVNQGDKANGEGTTAVSQGAKTTGTGTGTVAQGTGTQGEGTGTVGESTGTAAQGTGTQGEGTGTVGESTGTAAQGTGTQGEGTGANGESTGTAAQGTGTQGGGTEQVSLMGTWSKLEADKLVIISFGDNYGFFTYTTVYLEQGTPIAAESLGEDGSFRYRYNSDTKELNFLVREEIPGNGYAVRDGDTLRIDGFYDYCFDNPSGTYTYNPTGTVTYVRPR